MQIDGLEDVARAVVGADAGAEIKAIFDGDGSALRGSGIFFAELLDGDGLRVGREFKFRFVERRHVIVAVASRESERHEDHRQAEDFMKDFHIVFYIGLGLYFRICS